MIEEFIKIEQELKMNERKYLDFYYWETIRNILYNELKRKKLNLSESQSLIKKNNKRIFFNLITNLFKDNIFHIKEAKYLLFVHPRRILNENGFYECVYTDFISNRINPNDINIIEGYYDGTHKQPIKEEKIYYSDIINYLSRIYYYLNRKKNYNKIKSNIGDTIRQFILKVEKSFGITLDDEEIVGLVTKNYLYFFIKKKIYTYIIQKAQPKIIIEVVGYNFDNKIINYVAHEQNIPIIELQHGSIDKENINYNFEKNYKANYMADYLFTFSKKWNEDIELPENSIPIPVGFPFYENMRNQYINKYGMNNQKKKIIFVSQRPVGEMLSSYAVELYNQLKENNLNYQILFKLHPGEYDVWKSEYTNLYNYKDKIQVIEDSGYHIYKYFAESSIQIGVYSFALFEGIGFGLKTFIISTDLVDHMNSLISESNISVIDSPKEIIAELLNYQDEFGSTHIDAKSFFKMHSINNFFEEVNRIMNQRIDK